MTSGPSIVTNNRGYQMVQPLLMHDTRKLAMLLFLSRPVDVYDVVRGIFPALVLA